MKTTEEHLDDYLDKYNELKKKNELWRLHVTPQEFLAEVENIKNYGIEARKSNNLTEYHIQRSEEGMISVMLMNKVTLEEMKEQGERIDKAGKMQFAAEALEVQQQLKGIKSQLKFNDVVNIYSWLFRKQITLEMLTKEVFEDFSKTRHYELFLKKNDIDNRK